MAGDTTRLTGLDAARGIAVLGMFAVHVGPPPEPIGAGWLLVAADGRAPAVFTLIAGFSLALAKQRQRQREGWRPLLIRSAILGLLGLLLAGLSPGILVILAFYSVYFLAAEPFTRLRTRTLAIIAAASAVVGPVASYVLGDLLGHRTSGRGGTPVPQDLASWSGFGEMAEKLLLTGAYPLLTYFPYVLIGLALGRLATRTGSRPAGLHHPRTAWLLTAWGAAAALAGYGLSWLLVEKGGARQGLLAAIAREHPWALERDDPIGAVLGSQYGAIPSTSWDWLAVAGPYSQTPLETLGNAGVGAALIGLAVALARAPLAARVLRPLAAVGTMALSVYVVHALALAFALHGWTGWDALKWFSVTAVLACCVWQYALRGTPLKRGPLEWALRALSSPPRKA
ncbi:heparan-alpha-glucosaminide N-acetyltransferase domain-containing protein [Streptomyces sp. NBC_01304]|uniref:heparan-alpha-glucosaminide N-acetyltransferase domain-containing protein n=1 Tax=Streptomyces sp. NBC_01304 TaxID=2903818 RepID=UPI002E0D1E43|nr:heparan-alpha-glucosaminide N-acetyltransferase domain-containing protein [Streptomyces sp. NBC_01304]